MHFTAIHVFLQSQLRVRQQFWDLRETFSTGVLQVIRSFQLLDEFLVCFFTFVSSDSTHRFYDAIRFYALLRFAMTSRLY